MSWVRATDRSWSSWAATCRPLVRVAEALAMSYGWPPEQARLNRAEMPGRSAWNSEAFGERWQK